MKEKLKIFVKVIAIVIILVAICAICFFAFKAKTEKIANPVVSFEIENYGNVKIELYPEYAPNTVANFVKLVESGYYNDKVMYGKDTMCLYAGRSADGSVQEPTLSLIDSLVEKGSEKDVKYQIFGEFVANGFEKNALRHEKGIVSMIRSDYTGQMPTLVEESYNSANSQIGIIMNEESARDLNGLYAGFGRVIEGLDIIEKIYNETEIEEKTEENTSSIDAFKTKPVIKNVTVDTFGVNYGTPETVEYFDYQAYMTDLINQYYSNQNS